MTQPADPVKRVLAHAKEFLTGMKRALTARYYAIGLFFYFIILSLAKSNDSSQ